MCEKLDAATMRTVVETSRAQGRLGHRRRILAYVHVHQRRGGVVERRAIDLLYGEFRPVLARYERLRGLRRPTADVGAIGKELRAQYSRIEMPANPRLFELVNQLDKKE